MIPSGLDLIASGTVDISISFSGVDIFSKTEDLCLKTTCPIAKGPTEITLIEALPPIAPPVRGNPCSTVVIIRPIYPLRGKHVSILAILIGQSNSFLIIAGKLWAQIDRTG